MPVFAGRSHAAYCCVLGDMQSIAPYCFASGGRSLAPFSGPVRVALLWSYEAKAERCENNFTSERQWASRIFTVSRRSPLAGELMRGSFCEGVDFSRSCP
jgi:hypothetical protein